MEGLLLGESRVACQSRKDQSLVLLKKKGTSFNVYIYIYDYILYWHVCFWMLLVYF